MNRKSPLMPIRLAVQPWLKLAGEPPALRLKAQKMSGPRQNTASFLAASDLN